MRKTAWLLGALLLAGCVSVEDATIQKGMIHPRQQTLLLVYVSPGPWVTNETDTKVESAAKILPGLGMVVQSAQDDNDVKSSEQLRQYLPPFKPEAKLYPALMGALAGIGYPGVWVSTGVDCEITGEIQDKFNRAQSIREWRERYLGDADPSELRHLRNYSTFLSLDEALILEVNLQYGALIGDDGTSAPTLWSTSRLYRASTMKLLWSHEDQVSDKAAAKVVQEFMTAPKPLLDSYEKLAPGLAGMVAGALRAALSPAAVLPGAPAPSPAAPFIPRSTAPVAGLAPGLASATTSPLSTDATTQRAR